MKNPKWYIVFLLGLITSCIEQKTVTLQTPRLKGYFIGNNIPINHDGGYFVMADRTKFDSIFHAAATMSNEITNIDFNKSMIVAVAKAITNHEVTLTIDSCMKEGKELSVYYTYKILPDTLSFSKKPFRAAVIEKTESSKVIFVENGVTMKTVYRADFK